MNQSGRRWLKCWSREIRLKQLEKISIISEEMGGVNVFDDYEQSMQNFAHVATTAELISDLGLTNLVNQKLGL